MRSKVPYLYVYTNIVTRERQSWHRSIGGHFHLSLQICNPLSHIGCNPTIQGGNFCKEGLPISIQLSSFRVQHAIKGGKLCLQVREEAFGDVAEVARDVRLHPLQAAVDRREVYLRSRL